MPGAVNYKLQVVRSTNVHTHVCVCATCGHTCMSCIMCVCTLYTCTHVTYMYISGVYNTGIWYTKYGYCAHTSGFCFCVLCAVVYLVVRSTYTCSSVDLIYFIIKKN